MVEAIKYLLRFHDYVVIPSVGGFISHYEPAKRNLTTATISAPCKKIAFNQSLKENDGVLHNYLITQKGYSAKVADTKIDQFASQIYEALQTKGSFLFAGIGKLVLDTSNNLVFEPILKENLLLSSYGLERVIAEPIARIKEQFEEEKAAENSEKDNVVALPTKEEKFQPWYARVAAVIGMAFILTTAGMGILSGNVSTEQLSLFPFSQSAPKVYEANLADNFSIANNALVVNDFKLYTPQVETSKSLISASSNNFHIIVGSFLNTTRMNREIANMEAKGFKVDTLDGPNGYTRVALVFDENMINKTSKLSEIRASINKDAWTLNK